MGYFQFQQKFFALNRLILVSAQNVYHFGLSFSVFFIVKFWFHVCQFTGKKLDDGPKKVTFLAVPLRVPVSRVWVKDFVIEVKIKGSSEVLNLK